jgi:hypothetical protein
MIEDDLWECRKKAITSTRPECYIKSDRKEMSHLVCESPGSAADRDFHLRILPTQVYPETVAGVPSKSQNLHVLLLFPLEGRLLPGHRI